MKRWNDEWWQAVKAAKAAAVRPKPAAESDPCHPTEPAPPPEFLDDAGVGRLTQEEDSD